MNHSLFRVGTIYLPVQEVDESAIWYQEKLGAGINYKDNQKAIIGLAGISIFLVKSSPEQTSNFLDVVGSSRFAITFEVNGVEALRALHKELKNKGVSVGEIEDRGHPGLNFVFEDLQGNRLDVWSELSPAYGV
ncbi:VOC family protein [Halobacillus sp. Nhm2S1]|uniref:VOC family protein n=1 Tax=Halobacillus sp. Nhm2S1 TaxID=2866716 RepID=UPI001C733CC7|nr:VOC family protein [Halobacillus sp. Nhm2S1]MBX0358614.1 VOC family protein [Halobacillus sp. Nhm2S1]